MLLKSNIPLAFWAELALAIATLCSKSYSYQIACISPHEAWTKAAILHIPFWIYCLGTRLLREGKKAGPHVWNGQVVDAEDLKFCLQAAYIEDPCFL
jgi:hypothetical protein